MTQTFTKTDRLAKHAFHSDAYTTDGGLTWQWCSNNRYVPIDACRDYGIPCNSEAQKSAIDAEISAFVAEYRESMKNHKPSSEELSEMRAAFGHGATVIDVITGQRYKI